MVAQIWLLELFKLTAPRNLPEIACRVGVEVEEPSLPVLVFYGVMGEWRGAKVVGTREGGRGSDCRLEVPKVPKAVKRKVLMRRYRFAGAGAAAVKGEVIQKSLTYSRDLARLCLSFVPCLKITGRKNTLCTSCHQPDCWYLILHLRPPWRSYTGLG